jgi:hypothetical protein
MRVPFLVPAAGLIALGLTASPVLSANPGFDVAGTWAAEGKACSEAELFVEFDGREISAHKASGTKARVAAYSAAIDGDRVVVNLKTPDAQDEDAWSFVVEGSNKMRLDSAFFAPASEDGGLMKLTRCSRT